MSLFWKLFCCKMHCFSSCSLTFHSLYSVSPSYSLFHLSIWTLLAIIPPSLALSSKGLVQGLCINFCISFCIIFVLVFVLFLYWFLYYFCIGFVLFLYWVLYSPPVNFQFTAIHVALKSVFIHDFFPVWSCSHLTADSSIIVSIS